MAATLSLGTFLLNFWFVPVLLFSVSILIVMSY